MTPTGPVSTAAHRSRLQTFAPRRAPEEGRAAREPKESPTPLALERQATIPRTVESAGVVPRARSERINRAVNVVLAVMILVALSPLLLIVAAAVWLTSPGPILYTQTRIGLDRRRRGSVAEPYDRRMQDLGGRVFRIYKFRSMYIDAERRSGVVWATANDPRITPVGRLLRKCRLDELPQLFNVIRGEMNIVGPRPERPSLFVQLRTGIPQYPLRQLAKPGITGWAQINQAYDACLDDVKRKVQLDLEYLERQGMAEDMRILMRTVPVVLFRRGAL